MRVEAGTNMSTMQTEKLGEAMVSSLAFEPSDQKRLARKIQAQTWRVEEAPPETEEAPGPIKYCCYGICDANSRCLGPGVVLLPFVLPCHLFGRSDGSCHVVSRCAQCSKSKRWQDLCKRYDRKFCSLYELDSSMVICNKHFVGGDGPTEEHPDPIRADCTDQQMACINRIRIHKTPSPSYPAKRTKSDLHQKTLINEPAESDEPVTNPASNRLRIVNIASAKDVITVSRKGGTNSVSLTGIDHPATDVSPGGKKSILLKNSSAGQVPIRPRPIPIRPRPIPVVREVIVAPVEAQDSVDVYVDPEDHEEILLPTAETPLADNQKEVEFPTEEAPDVDNQLEIEMPNPDTTEVIIEPEELQEVVIPSDEVQDSIEIVMEPSRNFNVCPNASSPDSSDSETTHTPPDLDTLSCHIFNLGWIINYDSCWSTVYLIKDGIVRITCTFDESLVVEVRVLGRPLSKNHKFWKTHPRQPNTKKSAVRILSALESRWRICSGLTKEEQSQLTSEQAREQIFISIGGSANHLSCRLLTRSEVCLECRKFQTIASHLNQQRPNTGVALSTAIKSWNQLNADEMKERLKQSILLLRRERERNARLELKFGQLFGLQVAAGPQTANSVLEAIKNGSAQRSIKKPLDAKINQAT